MHTHERRTWSGKKTILCVDDEEEILQSLYRVLTRGGYRVLTSRCGKEALEILAKEKDVQLVIADQRMPGMTGDELVKEIRQRYPHVMRILLSAYEDFNALATAINEGEIYRFISKPWEEKELLEIIAKSFEHKETLLYLHELIAEVTPVLAQFGDVVLECIQERGILFIKATKKGGGVIPYEPLSHFLNCIMEIFAKQKLNQPRCGTASGIITRRGDKLILEIEIGGKLFLRIESPIEKQSSSSNYRNNSISS